VIGLLPRADRRANARYGVAMGPALSFEFEGATRQMRRARGRREMFYRAAQRPPTRHLKPRKEHTVWLHCVPSGTVPKLVKADPTDPIQVQLRKDRNAVKRLRRERRAGK
jgi:surfactin synthase thioesterase subunit